MKTIRTLFMAIMLASISSCGGYPKNDIYSEYIYMQRSGNFEGTSINEKIQRDIGLVMKNHKVPYGIVIIADARNGRILAVEEHSERGYDKGEFINKPLTAASIFKIVTLGAAIGSGIFNERDNVRYYDRPYSELEKYMQKRKNKLYSASTTVKTAMAMSNNSAFAEIGLKLNKKILYEYAEKFFFNNSFVSGVKTGYIEKPKDTLEYIRLCSGLKHSYMSPLHALLIMMSIANEGELVLPYINPNGAKKKIFVVKKTVADGLLKAMSSTTTSGTSRKQFGADLSVAKNTYAKTGSLYGYSPDGYYNWFAGVYDGKNSRYAVVVLTVNDPKWSVKANYIAYRAIEFVKKYEEN